MKPFLQSNIGCEDIALDTCKRDGMLTVQTGVLCMMIDFGDDY